MALPFYGATNPALFRIEREAMDRPGRVLDALDHRLPAHGLVVDIGAGDGYTAGRLTTRDRTVIAVEPAFGMRAQRRDPVPFVAGVAQALPLASGSVDAAISTWAYFFTGPQWDPTPGIEELQRVVRPGGPLLVVDNLGGDEFTALAGDAIAADPEQWEQLGFECEVVDTEFAFADQNDAQALLDVYFGHADRSTAPLRYSYRVGVFIGTSGGPTPAPAAGPGRSSPTP